MGSYKPEFEDSRKEINVLVTGFGAGTPNRPERLELRPINAS